MRFVSKKKIKKEKYLVIPFKLYMQLHCVEIVTSICFFYLNSIINFKKKGSQLSSIVVFNYKWAGFSINVDVRVTFSLCNIINRLKLFTYILFVMDVYYIYNCRYMRGRLTLEKANATINNTTTYAKANAQVIAGFWCLLIYYWCKQWRLEFYRD